MSAPAQQPRQPTANVRAWQIATAVLAVVSLTLLVTNVVLRSRADEAVRSEQEAVAALTELQTRNAELGSRNDTLLDQLSVSNERLTEIINSVGVPASRLSVSSRQVDAAVARLEAARTQRARQSARAQVAELCAAASLQAMGQVHAGPDIDSGSQDAAETLQNALPACRKALG